MLSSIFLQVSQLLQCLKVHFLNNYKYLQFCQLFDDQVTSYLQEKMCSVANQ